MSKEHEKPHKKLSKEAKERIDNKIVLATAIALVSAMVLLFLYNWSVSAYARQTMTLIKILMWVGVAGVAAMLVLYFLQKDRRFLLTTPYFAIGALFLREIQVGFVTRLLASLGSKVGFLSFLMKMNTTKGRFNLIYICLAIYLVASYIYYGAKLHRGK